MKSIQKKKNIIIVIPILQDRGNMFLNLYQAIFAWNKLLNKRLNSKILPNWNFAPERKTVKKFFLVKSFLKKWNIKKNNYKKRKKDP